MRFGAFVTFVVRATKGFELFWLQEEEFFFRVVEAVEINKLPLFNVLNFKKTKVALVASHPKPISPIGVKQVLKLITCVNL